MHAKIHPPLLQAPCSRFPHLCAPVGHERNRTVSPLLQAPYGRISAPFCPCANTDATALYRPCCKPRAAVFRALFAPVRIRTQLHCIAFAASTVQPYFRTSAPLCGHGRNRTVSPLPQAPYSRISAPLRPCAGTNATALYRLCRKPLTAVFPHLCAPVRARTQPHCIAFAASSVQPFFPRLCAPVRSRTRPHCIAFAASPVQPFPCLCAPVRARMQPHCITLCCKSLTAVFRAFAPLCGHERNRCDTSALPQAPYSRISTFFAPHSQFFRPAALPLQNCMLYLQHPNITTMTTKHFVTKGISITHAKVWQAETPQYPVVRYRTPKACILSNPKNYYNHDCKTENRRPGTHGRGVRRMLRHRHGA